MLSGQRFESVKQAIAAWIEGLEHAVDHAERGTRPLSMQDPVSRGCVLPNDFARFLVHRDEAGGARRGYVDMTLIVSVGRDDEEQVAVHNRRGVRHVVGEHPELLHHVQLPDNVCVEVRFVLFLGKRPVVLLVEESLRVQAHELATIGDVVEPVSFHQGRRADALKRPVVGAARG